MSNLPSLNAFLNFLSTIFLVVGFIQIKKKNEQAHKKCMLLALLFSSLFLIGYVIYHYNFGSTKFPELGWIKTLYLIILVPHVILAALMLPLIVATFYHAFKGNFESHKKFAKITFPIWFYVSFTGVIIYFMVYHWFKV